MFGRPVASSSRCQGPLEVPSEKDRATRPLYSAGTGFCTFVEHGIRTETEDGSVVKYDIHTLGSFATLARIRGTVLSSWSLWLHVGLYMCLAALVCAMVLALAESPHLVRSSRIGEAVNYFSIFVAFFLALHLALVVERWWEVRRSLLGELWRATNDLTMVLAVHFPSREHRRLKTLVLRYALLSFELMFMEARKGEINLQELRSRQLLRDDEHERLDLLASKPQVPWVWIAATFRRLASEGKLPSSLLVHLYEICMRARGAVGGVFVQLDAQLPFMYVHLLSALVHANNLLVAAKCGTLAAVAIWHLRFTEAEKGEQLVSKSENAQALFFQCLQALLIPLMTVGFLEVGILLADPFNSALQDFPRSAYHVWMRDECEAFQTAAEEAPKELGRVAAALEARQPHLVHDLICAL